MKLIKTAVAAALTLSTFACMGQTLPAPAKPPVSNLGTEIFKDIADVTDMVEVPDGPYHAVQNKGGGILFISSTGRFVLGGMAFDIWNRKPLRTVGDMRYAFNHLDLKGLGVQYEDLKPITIGEGAKEVVFFIDPNCSWCHKLLTEVKNDQALTKEYKIHILVVPALGQASFDKTKALYCTTEKNPEVLLAALMDNKIDTLPQPKDCDVQALDKRLVIAEALGVKSVPFIIGYDKRFTKGKPADLKAWLELGEKENERQAQIYREAIKRAAQKLVGAQQTPVPPQTTAPLPAPVPESMAGNVPVRPIAPLTPITPVPSQTVMPATPKPAAPTGEEGQTASAATK